MYNTGDQSKELLTGLWQKVADVLLRNIRTSANICGSYELYTQNLSPTKAPNVSGP